ncbi:MAG: DinB family protein, partial [Deltaproteobacteria bacterium]
MASSKNAQLAQMIHDKKEAFKRLCLGLDEETSSRAPAGRWSPKQIVSHLCGPEGIGFLPSIRAFVEQDTPRLEIEAENPFYSENRARMTLAELLSQFDQEYKRMEDFVAGLSEEQLGRKAHIPLLKETEIGEYPTLQKWIEAIAGYHMEFHINHMREI